MTNRKQKRVPQNHKTCDDQCSRHDTQLERAAEEIGRLVGKAIAAELTAKSVAMASTGKTLRPRHGKISSRNRKCQARRADGHFNSPHSARKTPPD